MYDLITNCFYDNSNKSWYNTIKKYRDSLLKNDSLILIEDFGAGSKSLSTNNRKISSIAKKAGISLKRAQFLGRLTQYFDSNHILEVGTSLGIATASMSLVKPNAQIITLEGCQNTANIAIKNFNEFQLNNINTIIGNFNQTLPKVLENRVFDLIFFDGNHQKEPTIQYFNQCLDHITNNSIFIFDDIYWSKGMKEAWLHIINHPKVTISIDTFYWGIVFFRKEQPKQHFIIRV